MPEKFNPENKETAPKIELKIVAPHSDKNFMVSFEGKTQKQCEAYNRAIDSVLSAAKLTPFHQIGTTFTGNNEPGYHAWEIWAKADRETIEALLPRIEQEARDILSE